MKLPQILRKMSNVMYIYIYIYFVIDENKTNKSCSTDTIFYDKLNIKLLVN